MRLPFKSTLLLICLLAPLIVSTTPESLAAPAQAPSEGFAHSAIRTIWQRDDGSASGKRTWLWGPGPFYTDYEPYTAAPQGNHLVQYLDKGRLEINDPDADPSS